MNNYIAIIRKSSHILSLDLSKMSQQIFDLKESEKRILKYLALEGPMNLSELSQHTTKYAYSLDRWSLKKHLEGSPRFMGLIPYEYVSPIQKNKKETRYELTTKGVLASLSFTSLEKIIAYQDYLKLLRHYFPHDGIENFIKEFVTEFIKLVLFWHYLSGINLTKLKSSGSYFSNFIEGIRRLQEINITQSQVSENPEFSRTVRNCIIYSVIIDLITSGNLFGPFPMQELIDWEKTKKWQAELESREYGFGSTLWFWAESLGSTIEAEVEEAMDASELSKFYSYDIIKDINKKLKKHNLDFLKWNARV